MAILNRCRTCEYWDASKDNKTGGAILGSDGRAQGECHRMPPHVACVATPQGLMVRTQFPITHVEMFCGEYAPLRGVQQ